MQPMLNTAVRAARSAGDLILRSSDNIGHLKVDQKGKNDYASEATHGKVAFVFRASRIKLLILNLKIVKVQESNLIFSLWRSNVFHNTYFEVYF